MDRPSFTSPRDSSRCLEEDTFTPEVRISDIQTSVPEEDHRHEVLRIGITATDTFRRLYHPVQSFQESVAHLVDVLVQYPVEMSRYRPIHSFHLCFSLAVHP